MYVTAYPCPMCLGAVYYAQPDRLFYAVTRDEEGEHYEDGNRLMTLATFYGEYAKAPEDRSLPAEQIRVDDATAPFREWTARVTDPDPPPAAREDRAASRCRLQDLNLQPPYYKYGALPIAKPASRGFPRFPSITVHLYPAQTPHIHSHFRSVNGGPRRESTASAARVPPTVLRHVDRLRECRVRVP